MRILPYGNHDSDDLQSQERQEIIISPANTAKIPATTLKTAYRNPIPILPLFSSSPVSKAKEENVVNPPHIPTFRNRTVRGLIE